MSRYYYSSEIVNFVHANTEEIVGQIAIANQFDLDVAQRESWLSEIALLKHALASHRGSIYFEYSIPRMGKRVDVILLIGPVVFVLEFKVGEKGYPLDALDQVFSYALDLKNFHEPSHNSFIAPVLIATRAKRSEIDVRLTPHNDKMFFPVRCNGDTLTQTIERILSVGYGDPIDSRRWESGRYQPTPTIVEAALALYKGHNVKEISRSEANATNLGVTTTTIAEIIRSSKEQSRKSIVFVTGVPGAGKTLVGLNIAAQATENNGQDPCVYLSGNASLVSILREALARDRVAETKAKGKKLSKKEALSQVKVFIQDIQHFRDDCLEDTAPPTERVAIFDEAQRTWDRQRTVSFMTQRKGKPNFEMSEPEFLISCLDRHPDWAVVICLVGGGQEINTGEAGIGEWIRSLQRSHPDRQVFISPQLNDKEYEASDALKSIDERKSVHYKKELHLSVSMRSFRAEHVSLLVKQLLDIEDPQARKTLETIEDKYPIVLTRDLSKAKKWLRQQARGLERYGILVSSKAERLKPHAIDVRSPMDPVHWFLGGKEDVRSSYYLEDVATEFKVQGLELDWACVTWDADFRFTATGWDHREFVGDAWYRIKKPERKMYLKNAYRVLLTRARQGMVIVVPEGDHSDPTRNPEFYDPTFNYLKGIGFKVM